MDSAVKKTVVVVNPRSAGGALERRWPEMARVLRRELGGIEAVLTTGPRDATRLAREAIAAGAELIVAVGGDGTIHEVVNGFFDDDGKPAGSGAALGILPFGTGGDFRRTAGIPREIDAAAAVLRAHKTRVIDVGRLEYRKHDGGGTGRSMFINSASGGMAGLVDQVANSSSKIAGGQISFLIASARAWLKYRRLPVRLVFDGKEDDAVEVKMVNVAVTNGRYFGGGMFVAPNAELDDGLFDVITIGDLSPLEVAMHFPKLYKGTHLAVPNISVRRAARVEISPLGGEVLLDVDGEQLGVLPATFTVVPRALTLVVPEHG